jgi:hypothetical protein
VSEMCYIFFSDKVFYEPVMTIRVFNDLDTACRSMGKGGGEASLAMPMKLLLYVRKWARHVYCSSYGEMVVFLRVFPSVAALMRV